MVRDMRLSLASHKVATNVGYMTFFTSNHILMTNSYHQRDMHFKKPDRISWPDDNEVDMQEGKCQKTPGSAT
jgi:hypothetical protein